MTLQTSRDYALQSPISFLVDSVSNLITDASQCCGKPPVCARDKIARSLTFIGFTLTTLDITLDSGATESPVIESRR